MQTTRLHHPFGQLNIRSATRHICGHRHFSRLASLGDNLRLDRYLMGIENLVLDPFGGSGSTLIACEKTGRQARLVELDPKYVDVIILRWQEFSGGAATLDGRRYEEIATGSSRDEGRPRSLV
jgi:hypothetical protein